MKYNLFDIGGEIVSNDDYGMMRENKELGNIWINSVLLYKEKSTKFMHYMDQDCVYIFIDGRGVFELGKEIVYVHHSDLVLVPQNTTHRIINTGDIHMKYLVFRERD